MWRQNITSLTIHVLLNHVILPTDTPARTYKIKDEHSGLPLLLLVIIQQRVFIPKAVPFPPKRCSFLGFRFEEWWEEHMQMLNCLLSVCRVKFEFVERGD